MNWSAIHPRSSQSALTRRSFLADLGMGFTGLALAAMLHKDGVARANSAPGVRKQNDDRGP